MSNWQTKSTTSFDAANNLLNAGLFNSSVHSSYYGCVQFVYHIMYAFWDEDILYIEAGGQQEKPPVTSHKWLKSKIYQSMRLKDKVAAVHFRDEMDDISGIRVVADYYFEIIEKEEAEKCNERALKLVSHLQKYYEL